MTSKTKRQKPDFSKLALETLAVRAGTRRTAEYQEHSEAMFLTSSFCFDSAELTVGYFIPRHPAPTRKSLFLTERLQIEVTTFPHALGRQLSPHVSAFHLHSPW